MKNYRTKTMQETILVFMMILAMGIQPLFGQTGVRIASTSGAADNSAMLDVISTSKGVLIPRMTLLQRTGISSPAQGLLVFQTDAPVGFYYFDGSVWVQLSAGALGGTGTTNYLARWTSTNQLSTGATYDDGTNVGISTSSPPYKLTIAGTGNMFGVDNTATFVAKNSGGTYETYFWPRWSDNIMYMNYGTGGLNIRNNASTSTMFMTNANNVGIGTSSPNSTLDVGGTSNTAFIQNMAAWGLNARTQGVIIIPEGTVTDNGAGVITFGSTVIIMNPLSGTWIRVAAGSYTLGSWDALYVDMPPTGTVRGTITPTVRTWSDVDRNYDGRDRIVLAQRNAGGPILTRFANVANSYALPKSTQVWNQNSGLPALNASAFTTVGGSKITVIFSGSGYGSGLIGIDLYIDGVVRGSSRCYTNEVSSHKSFAANALVITGLAAGNHSMQLVARSGTSTDVNDFFTATVIETPY